jgi:hypothetical protein
MAQIARTGADKATDTTRNATNNIAELRKRTADQASDSAPKAAERTEAMAQTVQRTAGALEKAQSQVAHQAAEGVPLQRSWVVEPEPPIGTFRQQHRTEPRRRRSGRACHWRGWLRPGPCGPSP